MPESQWIAAVYLVQAAGALLVALLCRLLHRRAERPFLLDWSLSWLALSVFSLTGLITAVAAASLAPAHPARVALTVAAVGAKYAQVAWLVLGARLLAGQPTRLRRHAWPLAAAIVVAAFAVTLATIGLPLGPRYLLRITLPQLAGAAGFAWTAWLVWRHVRTRGISHLLLAAIFVLYALTDLRYTTTGALQVLGTGASDPPWLALFDLFLHAGAAVGICALLFDEEADRREAGTSREEATMAALRSREQRDRLVLGEVSEIIYRVTPVRDGDPRTWGLTFINRRAEALVGVTDGRLDAESWAARIHPDDRDRIAASTTALLGSTQPATRRYRVVHAVTGEALPLEERVVPELSADGTVVGLYVVGRDVTAVRAAEDALRRGHEQLARAERLDAVGRLAGGLAQDFNNLLTTITGYATLVQAALPEGSPAARDAEGLIRSATRAADLTRQLQVFGGRQPTNGRPINLNAVVSGVAPMLARLLSARIVLDTALGPAVPEVEAERGSLEQVLLHFAVNARARAGAGGRLTLSTRVADGVDTEILGDRETAGSEGWVTLEIAGQGIAVSPSVLPAIFAPVTEAGPSRPGGRRPHLAIDSPGGDRVAVSIFFPVAPTPEAGLSPDVSVLPERRGGGTILVVEDDEAVRELVVDILARDGYRTIEAGHGQAALDELERRRQRIDLVLSDVVMPGMSGPELVRRVTMRRPDVPVLYMTGYAEPNPADAAALAAAPVLQKPFTPKALSDAVLHALAGRR